MEIRRDFTALPHSRNQDPLMIPASHSRQSDIDSSAFPRITDGPACRFAVHGRQVGGRRWRRPATLAFLLALVSFAPRPADGQTSEEQEAAYFRAGQQALKQGDLPGAAKEFKRVLDLDPKLVEARVNLGLIYHALGEYSLAANNLSIAVGERPGMAGPTVILGMDYLKLGLVDKAIAALQAGLRLDPSNLEGHRALSQCYLAKGDFLQTSTEYQELARLNPDKADAWYKLGHDFINLAARMAFRGAQVYRGSPWGNRFLGDMLFQRNRWADAAEEYQKALAVEPQQPGLHVALSRAYLMAGKPDQAEAELHLELQRDGKSEEAWLELAETRLSKGQATEALEAVGKIWEISPEFLALPRIFPSVELSRESAQTLMKNLAAAPEGAPKSFLLAVLSLAAGENAQADEKWKAFQTAYHEWQNGGHGAAAGGNPCSAHFYADCVHWLESRKPLSPSDQLLLGKTQFTLQLYGEAAESQAKLLGIDKGNVEASYWLARTFQALGAEAYDRLEESFPDSWRTVELRAEGYALRTRTNEALEEFQRAIQLRPDEPELHEARGELFLIKKSYDEAQAELETSLRLDPSRSHALALLGRLYVQKHENEKAIPYLQKALRYEPDMPNANNLLGTAYVRLGHDAKAIPYLEKAESADFYGDVHYQMYVAYRNLGKTQLAQQALARSQELRRNSAAAHQAMVSGVEKVE